MTDFVKVSAPAPTITIIQCSDCQAAWKETDEFVTECPRCGSLALNEHDAVLNPDDNVTYIPVSPPEDHPI